MWTSRLVILDVVVGEVSRRSQVVVPDSLKSVVAVKVVAADVVCGVGGADPSERHRVELGLNGINTCQELMGRH